MDHVARSGSKLHDLLASGNHDVIFINESPWYQVGINKLIGRAPDYLVMGSVSNQVYQYFHPVGNGQTKCNMSVYIKKAAMQHHSIKL